MQHTSLIGSVGLNGMGLSANSWWDKSLEVPDHSSVPRCVFHSQLGDTQLLPTCRCIFPWLGWDFRLWYIFLEVLGPTCSCQLQECDCRSKFLPKMQWVSKPMLLPMLLLELLFGSWPAWWSCGFRSYRRWFISCSCSCSRVCKGLCEVWAVELFSWKVLFEPGMRILFVLVKFSAHSSLMSTKLLHLWVYPASRRQCLCVSALSYIGWLNWMLQVYHCISRCMVYIVALGVEKTPTSYFKESMTIVFSTIGW